MKFNIDDYKGEYAMHCETEKDADNFCEYLYKTANIMVGLRLWCISGNYVYYFNNGTWGDKEIAIKNGYTILEWSDFMNGTFTKSDLKTGDVILRRDGNVEIVIKECNVLIKPRECNRLADINEDLTHSFFKDGDIVAVRRPKIPTDCQFSAFKENRGTLIYDRERDEVEELTLAEVCKLLGKNIKIIQ